VNQQIPFLDELKQELLDHAHSQFLDVRGLGPRRRTSGVWVAAAVFALTLLVGGLTWILAGGRSVPPTAGVPATLETFSSGDVVYEFRTYDNAQAPDAPCVGLEFDLETGRRATMACPSLESEETEYAGRLSVSPWTFVLGYGLQPGESIQVEDAVRVLTTSEVDGRRFFLIQFSQPPGDSFEIPVYGPDGTVRFITPVDGSELDEPAPDRSTTSTSSSVSPGVSVTEVWSVPGIGISGTNFGDLSWVLRSNGDMVYVAGGNRETVTALDPATGEKAWQRSIGGGAVGLLYADDDIVVARGYGLVHALDPSSGETVWSLELDGRLWPTGAVRSDHGLHVLVDRPTEGDVEPPQVITVDPEDGSTVWSVELNGIDHPDLDLQPHGSALVGDQLLVKSTGALHALDITIGAVNWVTQFGAVPETYWPTPLLIVDETVFVADPDGELAAIKLLTGEELWRQAIAEGRVGLVGISDDLLIYTDGLGTHGASRDTGEIEWSQPGERAAGALIKGRLLVLSRGSLAGLDPDTGSPLWSQQADVEIPYGVIDLGGPVAAVAEEGIIVVQPSTGALAEMIGAGAVGPISAPVAESPLLVSDLMIVSHSDGSVTAYRVSS